MTHSIPDRGTGGPAGIRGAVEPAELVELAQLDVVGRELGLGGQARVGEVGGARLGVGDVALDGAADAAPKVGRPAGARRQVVLREGADGAPRTGRAAHGRRRCPGGAALARGPEGGVGADQTLRLLNQGYTGPEIAEMIELPPALEQAWPAT